MLDWELADGATGLDVLRKVRQQQQQARVVVVSGNSREKLSEANSDELSALGVATHDWWVKPVTMGVLEAFFREERPSSVPNGL